MGRAYDEDGMLASLEKQFLRSWSERAQLLGPLVFEKVAAETQTLSILDSLAPATNLDQGKVGKRREEC